MEIIVTDQGTFELLIDKAEVLLHIAAFAFSVAIFVMIISSAWKLGWKLWPWVFAMGFLAWLVI
jgi:hypothetical protein